MKGKTGIKVDRDRDKNEFSLGLFNPSSICNKTTLVSIMTHNSVILILSNQCNIHLAVAIRRIQVLFCHGTMLLGVAQASKSQMTFRV